MATATNPLQPDPNPLVSPTDPNQNQMAGISPLAPAAGKTPGSSAPANTTSGTNQPGLINNAMGSTGYTPKQNTLTPDQTVAGNVEKLIASDSPLIEQAKTGAAEQMNARGLVNSSIGIGAGEAAVQAAALPIAQQDANAALTVGQANQTAENAALAQGASSESQVGLQKLAGQQSLDLATLQGNIQTNLTNIQEQSKQLMQTNQSAAQFFSQTAASISDILKEPNINVADKQTLVQKQIDLLQNGLAVIGGISNIDLSSLLNFGATPGTTATTPPPLNAPMVTPTAAPPAVAATSSGGTLGTDMGQGGP